MADRRNGYARRAPAATLTLDPPTTADLIPPIPPRPARKLRINAEKVVDSVLRRADAILADMDRSDWMYRRLQRYAKYRGWLGTKTFPWANCSNVHIPMLQIAELRANAGLHNVVMTLRPLLSAKAARRDLIAKEQRITDLVDTQMFLDPGPDRAERILGDYTSNFLQDTNAVAFTPWVRDERMVTTIKYRPRVPDGEIPAVYIARLIEGSEDAQGKPVPGLLPNVSALIPGDHPYEYEILYRAAGKDRTATCKVFQNPKDESLELEFRHEATLFDGPVMQNVSLDRVLAPNRCENLQPPSGANVAGAPYVFLRATYRLSEILREWKSGQFNWLTAKDVQTIIDRAKVSGGPVTGASEDALQEQKDRLEGREHRVEAPELAEEDAHLPVEFYMAFDRWDIDGDGLVEEVYWLIARDAKVLVEARPLTEKWPVEPDELPYRPLAEACAIPVPGRWLGISYLELGEALYDLIKGTFDQVYDSATVANLPFFFYGASAGWRGETLSLEPGKGNPVPGNPKENIYIPTFPGANQQWGFSIIGLASGFFQQAMAIGDLQNGRVPTGKASALRTYGTTAAILQQGDVRADQLLLRLFAGLRQVATNFHRMNRHLLPEGKEFRRLGYDGPEQEAYVTIRSIEEIDAAVQFDFRPDFLLSNPQMLAATLQQAMQMVVTPMAIQMKMTSPEQIYELVRDYLRAVRLDPKKYITRPTEDGLPRILAEEFISSLIDGRFLEGLPLEGNEPHLLKLFEFSKSPSFAALQTPDRVEMFRAHTERVARLAQQDKMAAAAQQFQTSLTQGGAGTRDTTMQEPPMTAGATGMPQMEPAA